MAVAAIGSYIVVDREKGRLAAMSVLLVLFAVWVTMTTAFWAEVPASAWEKWNYAFKNDLLRGVSAVRVPLAHPDRVAHADLSLLAHGAFPARRGEDNHQRRRLRPRIWVLSAANALLSEGSTLAGVSLMLIPMIFYLRKHTLIMPRSIVTQLGYSGLITLALGSRHRHLRAYRADRHGLSWGSASGSARAARSLYGVIGPFLAVMGRRIGDIGRLEPAHLNNQAFRH